MIILALDQSLKVSGVAIFDKKELVHYETFSIKPDQKMERRLTDIWENLNELYHDFQFEKIYFEDIQLQAGNALTYKHLAYVQASIILWCYYNSVPYEIYAASHWRKVLGGGFGRKRQEQKEHAIQLVKDRYNIDVSSDEADAICIGMAAIKEKEANQIGFQ